MRFLVIGAGKMGRAVIYDLRKNCPEARLIVVDSNEPNLELISREFPDEKISVIRADASDIDELSYVFSSADVAISCVSSRFNYSLSKAAIEAGTHFCDLGGNEDIVRKQFLLDEAARDRGVSIIPDCGLAPGMLSILAGAAYAELDECTDIFLRAGSLPLEPRLPLNQSHAYSIVDLLDSYAEDATIIKDGKLLRVASLTGLEEIEFNSPFDNMEAFHASGGISTLPTSFGHKLKNLDYKVIRYHGHCEKAKILKDLGFLESSPMPDLKISPRDLLAKMLERRLPVVEPDVVLIRVEARGFKNGEARQISFEAIDYMDEENNLPAMMRSTAFPVSIIAQMLASEQIKERGVLYQEKHIPVAAFTAELAARGFKLSKTEKTFVVRGN